MNSFFLLHKVALVSFIRSSLCPSGLYPWPFPGDNKSPLPPFRKGGSINLQAQVPFPKKGFVLQGNYFFERISILGRPGKYGKMCFELSPWEHAEAEISR
jgi:hypothetical protein